MMNKIASYNLLTDRGMMLIAKIAHINESMRTMLIDLSPENVDSLVAMSKDLESSIQEYQTALVESFTEIASDSETEEAGS